MRTVWLLALAAVSAGAHAQQMTIYRCTNDKGQVIVQNDQPCPKGMQEQKRVIDAPAPSATAAPARAAAGSAPASAAGPARAAAAPTAGATSTVTGGARATGTPGTPPAAAASGAASTAAAPAADATAPAAPGAAPAPPPLFECRGRDGVRYFAQTAEPAPRCLAMSTTGIDGRPETAAGTACETVQDTCAPVADTALCEAWRGHMADLERQTREADANRRPVAQDELEAAVARYEASTCGTPGGVIPVR